MSQPVGIQAVIVVAESRSIRRRATQDPRKRLEKQSRQARTPASTCGGEKAKP